MNFGSVIAGIFPEIAWSLALLTFVLGVLLPAVWGSAHRRRAAMKVIAALGEIVEAVVSATRRQRRHR